MLFRSVIVIPHRTIGLAAAAVVAASLTLGACSSEKSDAQKASDLLNKGIAAQTKGDVRTAFNDYNEVLRIDPRNKFAYYNLGLIAQNGRDYVVARTDYGLSLSTDPSYAPALYNLAIVERSLGEAQTAVGLYERAVASDPKFAAAYLNLGLLQRELGDKTAGDENLKKAVALDTELAKRIPGGVPGGSSFLGTFDRDEAVEVDIAGAGRDLQSARADGQRGIEVDRAADARSGADQHRAGVGACRSVERDVTADRRNVDAADDGSIEPNGARAGQGDRTVDVRGRRAVDVAVGDEVHGPHVGGLGGQVRREVVAEEVDAERGPGVVHGAGAESGLELVVREAVADAAEVQRLIVGGCDFHAQIRRTGVDQFDAVARC